MFRSHYVVIASLLVLSLFAGFGCQDRGTNPATDGKPAGGSAPADHVHERGKMLIADVGEYHALLTAHLSKEGNELDIFFETNDAKNPQPIAIPVESFKAFATAKGSADANELQFEPAPADERPKGEKAGTCSHFVAKAPWLKPGEVIEVVVPSLKVEGNTYRVTWKNFDPKKYAHHED